jgi:hypothetical protein
MAPWRRRRDSSMTPALGISVGGGLTGTLIGFELVKLSRTSGYNRAELVDIIEQLQ